MTCPRRQAIALGLDRRVMYLGLPTRLMNISYASRVLCSHDSLQQKPCVGIKYTRAHTRTHAHTVIWQEIIPIQNCRWMKFWARMPSPEFFQLNQSWFNLCIPLTKLSCQSLILLFSLAPLKAQRASCISLRQSPFRVLYIIPL